MTLCRGFRPSGGSGSPTRSPEGRRLRGDAAAPALILGHVPDSDAVPPSAGSSIARYSGIYNADGGVVGEIRYVFGHLFGSAECSLCDITHSPVRRKPEWDRMVASLGVPIVLLHRNELDDALDAAVRDIELPMVVAHHEDGSASVALNADDLRQLRGSVGEFERALLTRRSLRQGAQGRDETT